MWKEIIRRVNLQKIFNRLEKFVKHAQVQLDVYNSFFKNINRLSMKIFIGKFHLTLLRAVARWSQLFEEKKLESGDYQKRQEQ